MWDGEEDSLDEVLSGCADPQIGAPERRSKGRMEFSSRTACGLGWVGDWMVTGVKVGTLH